MKALSRNLFAPAPFTLEDVFDAYFDCRRHKRNTINQLSFEADLERNLLSLWRDLNEGRYEIGRSIAFVVTRPKVREVWAADFRDRVVHHMIYNRISDHFYRRFIRDSYACIPGRGIHDGMRRISYFGRSVTENWTKPAYALKVDIANFFGSIDRRVLLEILRGRIAPSWCLNLTRQVIEHDPRKNAVFRSSPALFDSVPRHKSLLHGREGKGLPIGNLTSQFFANIYLNELDQFVKHGLKARYYGRYVDDMILFHEDAGVLNDWRRQIEEFLESRLCLALHPDKVWLNRADAGINFAGFIIKPGRTYLRRCSIARCKQKVRAWERKGAPVDAESLRKVSQSLNIYIGMLRNVDGYRARHSLCSNVESLFLRADENCTKILPA